MVQEKVNIYKYMARTVKINFAQSNNEYMVKQPFLFETLPEKKKKKHTKNK